MKNIIAICFISFLQTAAWADLLPSYCTDYGSFYDCKIGDDCSCTIYAGTPGDKGKFYYKFMPIEKKKYQCIFTMSPLSLSINLSNSHFPEKVKYEIDWLKLGHDVKVMIDARDMVKTETEIPYVMIRFDFGSYDAPSVLSAKCIVDII